MESIAPFRTETSSAPPVGSGAPGPAAPLAPAPSATLVPPVALAPSAVMAPSAVRSTSPEGRAPGVLDLRRRVALADRFAGLVRLADGPLGTAAPAPRAAIRAARGRLLDLEHVLRSGVPISRLGEHRAERLADDAESGAYAAADPLALHDDAAAACAAVGSVTPFH